MTEPVLDEQTDDYGSHRGIPTGPIMEVVYVCALAACVAGLYFGMHYGTADDSTGYRTTRAETSQPIPKGVVPATAYADIHAGNLGPNAQRRTRLVAKPAPTVTQQPVVPGDDARKRADLAARAERRAYNGAPPTIPHRIDPRDATSCVACHGAEGMQAGEVVARPMPHAHYASCTQCHVQQETVAEEESHWLDNGFAGLPAPNAGHRAYPGAPPTIPHSTAMRENCATCHGWSGADGLKSSHPWRDSCTQCHAPWASRNAQPGADANGALFLPGPNTNGSAR